MKVSIAINYNCMQIYSKLPCIHTYLNGAFFNVLLHWEQQHNVCGLELPDQLPDISPGRLGCHKRRALGVALCFKVEWILMLCLFIQYELRQRMVELVATEEKEGIWFVRSIDL